jgi:hypothetical protein
MVVEEVCFRDMAGWEMAGESGYRDDAVDLALVRWSLSMTPLQRLVAAEKRAGLLTAIRMPDHQELKLLRMTLEEISRRKA